MIKFTAETKCSGVDLADGTQIRKGAFDAIRKICLLYTSMCTVSAPNPLMIKKICSTTSLSFSTLADSFKKIQGESLLSVFSKSVTNDLYIKNPVSYTHLDVYKRQP